MEMDLIWPDEIPYTGNPGAEARYAVRKAIKAGVLLPLTEQRCIGCLRPAKHYHHMEGYEPESWLVVVPFCASCHSSWHGDNPGWVTLYDYTRKGLYPPVGKRFMQGA